MCKRRSPTVLIGSEVCVWLNNWLQLTGQSAVRFAFPACCALRRQLSLAVKANRLHLNSWDTQCSSG